MASELELEPVPHSVGEARSFARRQLAEIGQEDLLDAASLLISVADHDPASPVRKGFDAEAGSGRGLQLVETMSLAFGEERTDDGGKVVWCDLAWTG